MRQWVADTIKFGQEGEVGAGIPTLLILEFRVIIIENRRTVLRGEAIRGIFFRGAVNPRSASSTVGCSTEKLSVSGPITVVFDSTHQATARRAITQCHWSGRSDSTTSVPAILVTAGRGGVSLGVTRNLVSRQVVEEEGTYLPSIGVVLVGTEVISGRKMLRDLRTDLVCTERTAVAKYFRDEESP
jgi:hypothetical protein